MGKGKKREEILFRATRTEFLFSKYQNQTRELHTCLIVLNVRNNMPVCFLRVKNTEQRVS